MSFGDPRSVPLLAQPQLILSMYARHTLFFLIPTIFNLLLPFFTSGLASNLPRPCPSSSCGNIKDIRYPFRLKTDPKSCGYDQSYDSYLNSGFELDCQNNRTVVNLVMSENSRRYFVQEINYEEASITLVDSNINWGNLSSCPLDISDFFLLGYGFSDSSSFLRLNTRKVAFVHCKSPVNSAKYVKAPFCGNRSNIFDNSSEFYSYAMIGDIEQKLRISDLEESCTPDTAAVAVLDHWSSMDKPSWASIFDALAHGFKLSWTMVLSDRCWGLFRFNFEHPFNYEKVLCCYLELNCYSRVLKTMIKTYLPSAIVALLALRVVIGLVIGFPLLIWFVVRKWTRRHLCMDKIIEEFLQDQHNFAPIEYTYSEIKKMTNKFSEKLGEGGYGTVYKGKLQSGPFVAIKMMDQSIATEEEFINEVGTIGRIHHVNIVQLVGFCVERSKYALVYELLPNGSLDRYIFTKQSLDILALTSEKMLEIALGVARGINYLHHGCDMQILHFDIKPHNILLDEKFNPKISDFGLARQHPTNESFINLTAARGTLGYMAPEMFYKNMGGISYKIDVYSYGMLLMEIVGRRTNMNPLVEDTSKMYFPSWVHDQLSTGKDVHVEVNDGTEEARLIVKKILIVALWCIQMRPSNRPSMNEIVEMLEGDSEPRMPPKPFLAPHEIPANDDGITLTYNVDYIDLDLSEN